LPALLRFLVALPSSSLEEPSVSEAEREAAKSESFVSESERVGSGGTVAEGIVGVWMVAVGGGVEVGSLV